jgi:hypothetical protein
VKVFPSGFRAINAETPLESEEVVPSSSKAPETPAS